MKNLSKKFAVMFGMLGLMISGLAVAGNPCAMNNPCSMKNPCAMKHNPCAMKHNPCATKNPCAMNHSDAPKSYPIDKTKALRPSGTSLAKGDHKALLKEGEALFSDPSLSSNGFTCGTCHSNHATFSESFARPYPHKVDMVKVRAGIDSEIAMDEMVQFCLLAPMASKTLPWDSRQLAALTTYVGEVQRTFVPEPPSGKTNPCSMNNPCAMKHNPCAMKR